MHFYFFRGLCKLSFVFLVVVRSVVFFCGFCKDKVVCSIAFVKTMLLFLAMLYFVAFVNAMLFFHSFFEFESAFFVAFASATLLFHSFCLDLDLGLDLDLD